MSELVFGAGQSKCQKVTGIRGLGGLDLESVCRDTIVPIFHRHPPAVLSGTGSKSNSNSIHNLNQTFDYQLPILNAIDFQLNLMSMSKSNPNLRFRIENGLI